MADNSPFRNALRCHTSCSLFTEVEKPHIPIIMGNSGSSSYVYELPTGDNQTTNPPAKKSESSRMNKVRTSIRNALNRRSNKDITDKKKKDDKTNNNNNGVRLR